MTGLVLRAMIIAGIAAVLGTGLIYLRYTGVVSGRAEVQASWDADKAQVAKETADSLARVAASATALQAKADKERGTLNAQIHSIDLERDELLRRLRARPARPEGTGGVPPNTGPGPSCTGASLYAPDGEFLAREAARGDAIRARLASCESAYKRAQDAVNSAVPAP